MSSAFFLTPPPDAVAQAIALLKQLIATPSFSREEHNTADILQEFFHVRHIPTKRQGNNVWVCNTHYDDSLPTVLLNSHHDTVRPNQDWTRNPFQPTEVEDERGVRLYGLGSNDAGGALVSLIATFLYFYDQSLPFNLIVAATAEEEIIGRGGVESILPNLGVLSVAIVGEPTGGVCRNPDGTIVPDGTIGLAIAEKGLLVLDCTAHGQSGHAARNTGVNAIKQAMEDIAWLHSYNFPNVSPLLGPITMNVTMIQAGTQHNVIPDRCSFVVDVRTTDAYTNEETLAIIKSNVRSEVKERSTRLRPSAIDPAHPLVQAAMRLGLKTFASPTMSDQTVIPIPSVKIGPGLSERSHTADEFIYLHEIQQGIATYIALLRSYAESCAHTSTSHG